MAPVVLVLVLLLAFVLWRQILALIGATLVILIVFGCVYLTELIQQMPT